MSDLDDLSDQALQQLLAKREQLLKQLTLQKGFDPSKEDGLTDTEWVSKQTDVKTRKRKKPTKHETTGENVQSLSSNKKMAIEAPPEVPTDGDVPVTASALPIDLRPTQLGEEQVAPPATRRKTFLSSPTKPATLTSSTETEEPPVKTGTKVTSPPVTTAAALTLPTSLTFGSADGRSDVSSEESGLDDEEELGNPGDPGNGDPVVGSDDEEGFEVCEEVYSGDEAEKLGSYDSPNDFAGFASSESGDFVQTDLGLSGQNESSELIPNESAPLNENGSADLPPSDPAALIAHDSDDLITNDSDDLIANDSADLIANDSADLIANDSAELTANDSANLIPHDSTDLIVNESADLVANDSADSLADEPADLMPSDSADSVPSDSSDLALNADSLDVPPQSSLTVIDEDDEEQPTVVIDSPEQLFVLESEQQEPPGYVELAKPTPAASGDTSVELGFEQEAPSSDENGDSNVGLPSAAPKEDPLPQVETAGFSAPDATTSCPMASVKRCPYSTSMSQSFDLLEKVVGKTAGGSDEAMADDEATSSSYQYANEESLAMSHQKENICDSEDDDDDDDDEDEEDGNDTSFQTVEEDDVPVQTFSGGFFRPNVGAGGKNPTTLNEIFDLDTDKIDGLGEDEIDALLEKPMVDYKKEKDLFAGLKKPPDVKNKIVLKYRGTEFFEVLPDGWIELTHCSGIPVYLHKASRVCSFSRPYFIGPGSARRHDVPISAIPCLYQRRVQEMERAAEQKRQQAATAALVATVDKEPETEEEQASASGKLPEVTVESADDFKKRCLSGGQLHDYCSKSFEFYTLKVWRFKTWSEHRRFHKQQRYKRRPVLPANVKLITVPAAVKGSRGVRRQFFLNPHGKTSVCLLHEYVQRAMHSSPEYEFGQTNNAAQPYSATVIIQKTLYATGYGNNKKTAKLDAARLTLQVLIPKMDFNDNSKVKLPNEDDVLELFDNFRIDDSRVYELASKAGQPNPYEILMVCLKRNSAFGNTKMATDIKHVKHQQHRYSMTVGKHRVSVLCSNKKEGKQKAAQLMLEELHPHIKTWGSLIRLYGYGTGAQKGTNGKKDKGAVLVDANGDFVMVSNNSNSVDPAAREPGDGCNQNTNNSMSHNNNNNNGKRDRYGMTHPPNKSILEKLRREMTKLYEQRDNKQSKSDKERKNEMVADVIKNISF